MKITQDVREYAAKQAEVEAVMAKSAEFRERGGRDPPSGSAEFFAGRPSVVPTTTPASLDGPAGVPLRLPRILRGAIITGLSVVSAGRRCPAAFPLA